DNLRRLAQCNVAEDESFRKNVLDQLSPSQRDYCLTIREAMLKIRNGQEEGGGGGGGSGGGSGGGGGGGSQQHQQHHQQQQHHNHHNQQQQQGIRHVWLYSHRDDFSILYHFWS
ncbi:hypothetical protein BGW38_007748, partial [Lunasporangiospora selenospora]